MSIFDHSTNTHRDPSGTAYHTPDNKPAANGTAAITYVNGQPVQGQIIGQYFTSK